MLGNRYAKTHQIRLIPIHVGHQVGKTVLHTLRQCGQLRMALGSQLHFDRLAQPGGHAARRRPVLKQLHIALAQRRLSAVGGCGGGAAALGPHNVVAQLPQTTGHRAHDAPIWVPGAVSHHRPDARRPAARVIGGRIVQIGDHSVRCFRGQMPLDEPPFVVVVAVGRRGRRLLGDFGIATGAGGRRRPDCCRCCGKNCEQRKQHLWQ